MVNYKDNIMNDIKRVNIIDAKEARSIVNDFVLVNTILKDIEEEIIATSSTGGYNFKFNVGIYTVDNKVIVKVLDILKEKGYNITTDNTGLHVISWLKVTLINI